MASIPSSTIPHDLPYDGTLPAVERYFEVSLYLMVATGVLAIISTGKLDIFSTVVPAVALLYKGIRVRRGLGPELSSRAATWCVLGYFLFFPLDLWMFSRHLAAGAPNPSLYAALLAAIHLVIFATLIRLYSARTNRDFAFLAVLAVASMLVSAILTVETGFLVALAVFLVLSVSTFVALEIRRSSAGAVSPPLEVDSTAAHKLNRALGITSALVAGTVLTFGILIFLLIPRFTTGYLSAINLQPSLMTGFSENVSLGEIGELKKNAAVVLRIRVDGDPARASDIHWRGIVLTNFDGSRWFTPVQDQTIIMPNPDGDYSFASPRLDRENFSSLHYTVLMEPIATDAIFVASQIATLRGRFGNEVNLPDAPSRRGLLFIDQTGSIFNLAHNNSKIRYEGLSYVPTTPPADLRKAPSAFPEAIHAIYLQLPALDPRIPKLAADVTASSKNEYDKASAIRNYLIAHYSYTLDLSGSHGADPLANFLFVRRAGHCEYFASAMTVMLRSIGVPARYVTGFLPGEYNDLGGDYIIRQSDAHSWVEVYFPTYGWVTFDPTPSGNEKRTGFLSRVGLYWDWLQLTWGEWIINYDFSHQLVLGQNLHKSSRSWSDHAREIYRQKEEATMQRLLALDRRAEASPYLLPGVLILLVVIFLAMRGRSIIRYAVARWALRSRRGGNLTASLAALEYAEMLRILEVRGWKKSLSQTPLEFAAAIPADLSAPILQLTEIYQAARFGSHPAPIERMSSLLRLIKNALRSGAASH